MHRVVVRQAADAAFVGGALFLAAGTLAWWRGWVLLAVLLAVRTIGAVIVYRVHPNTLRERARLPLHDAQPAADRVLVLAVLATGFLGIPALAALDAMRWHLRPAPSPGVAWIGLALFALGWTLKSVALHANAFAVAVVRMQPERRHAVADGGVYGVVRHPFYAADPLIFVGSGVWLGSYAAALGAVVPVALMVLRLVLEERFLHRELPGYTAYAARVRYRLIPGVW